MIVDCYLHVSKSGKIRLTKFPSVTEPDEVTIGMELTIPNALFQKPRLTAKISIAEEAAISPVIDAEVIENIQDAIRTSANLDLHIDIIENESTEPETG